ncbi:MAG: hypothetical protein KGQ93_01835 [Cyanobacteria bacterium REEB459]|nr:hypothetical protein [Cyanobacteria bacterium REEB459]
MAQLIPIVLEDGTEIYIEATENVGPATATLSRDGGGETTRTTKGLGWDTTQPGMAGASPRGLQGMEGTIRAYTRYTLNAFKDMTVAHVDKVTLEFGLKVSGEAGIPYVTKGTAESNLKITVECSFDRKPD